MQRPVPGYLAMTGEITLRGDVLPIGGLKEKLLAAKRGGIKKVLIPNHNQKDLRELTEQVTDGLNIICVNSIEEVIKEVFSQELNLQDLLIHS